MNQRRPCVHHWRIETPSGAPTVAATCLDCGASRSFPTVAEPEPSRRWDPGMLHPTRRAERASGAFQTPW